MHGSIVYPDAERLAAAVASIVADAVGSSPGLRLALFPQEWYRDHASDWLDALPTDAPWHDPAVLLAMLRLPFR